MLEKRDMEVLKMYMYDEIIEEVHYKYAPCSNEFFLKKYCEIDKKFKEFIYNEFGIDIDELIA